MSTVTVRKGSSYSISSGGSDSGDIVLSGGSMFVLSGGFANETTVSSGGHLTVSSGGVVSSTILVGGTSATSPPAVEIVRAGGTDLAAVISVGGVQEVFGYASGATVGVNPQPFFALGGTQVVEAGGTASGTTVLSGGTLELLGAAIASGYAIDSGGALEIGSGYVVSGYHISGTSLEVISGGTAIDTIVSGGADNFDQGEFVSTGGTDLGARIAGCRPRRYRERYRH
jgi:autotransporter passenger strand-loop-strand repeat protein